jgi:DNA helicase-2/ATP-dependent DNA helicase PcrA
MRRLYLTRAGMRMLWGSPSYNQASRYFEEIPEDLLQWRRAAPPKPRPAPPPGRSPSTSRHRTGEPAPFGSGVPRAPRASKLTKGDMVLHNSFGIGIVQEAFGEGDDEQAVVDFGSEGVKRLMLRFAPLEKLS